MSSADRAAAKRQECNLHLTLYGEQTLGSLTFLPIYCYPRNTVLGVQRAWIAHGRAWHSGRDQGSITSQGA